MTWNDKNRHSRYPLHKKGVTVSDIATPGHDSIQKVPAKSKYFEHVQLPDELTASPEDFCKNAWYSNLFYDPYREVYYRIAYPPSTLDKDIRPLELIQFGRKNFSILILDKDFRILGETLFPDNSYNPQIMFVRPEGLYISDSHYLNPRFNDDILSFRKYELAGEWKESVIQVNLSVIYIRLNQNYFLFL